MTSKTSLFVDELLDDTVRSWMRERDLERAWWRNECLPHHLARLTACTRLAEAQRRGVPLPAVRLNYLRGRCAEEQLVRRLCGRGFDVRNQLRVGPRRGGSVLDISPFPGGRRPLPAGLESKYIHTPDHRDASGRLQVGAILAQVPQHVAQVRRHMAHSVPPSRPGVPARVRLVYQLGGPMAEAEFRQVARALYKGVAAANAARPGVQVRATVMRAP